jgi:tetratricopeptide (TPR) repeat protein
MKLLRAAAGALFLVHVLGAPGRSGEPQILYAQRRARLNYSVRSGPTAGGTGLTVELHQHVGEGKWQRRQRTEHRLEAGARGEALTARGHFTIEREVEGTYDFAISVVDERGNREGRIDRDTAPGYRVVIDRTPPWIIAKRLGPADRPADAARVRFAWATRDPSIDQQGDRPVELQARLKGEQEWRTIGTGLPPVGMQAFPQLAAVAARLTEGELQVRFRVTDRAGNVNTDPAGSVLIDRLPPRGGITGPLTAPGLEVDVFYEVADQGAAGLADVGLWISADEGESWSRRPEKLPLQTGKVRIRLTRGGAYGLYLSAADSVGNALRTPEPGARPQLRMLVDTAPPRLKFAGALLLVADRRGPRERGLSLRQRELALRALESHPFRKDFTDWREANSDLWKALVRDHDANGDRKLTGAELKALKASLENPLQLESLKRLEGLALCRDRQLLVRWRLAEENPREGPVAIEFSSDGGDSWSLVATNLPDERQPSGNLSRDRADRATGECTGSYWWRPPRVSSARCLLRVTARDLAGNSTSWVSRPFSVENRAPHSSAELEKVEPPPAVPAVPEGAAAGESRTSSRAVQRARQWMKRADDELAFPELVEKVGCLFRAGEVTRALVSAGHALRAKPKGASRALRARLHLLCCRALRACQPPLEEERLGAAIGACLRGTELQRVQRRLAGGPGRRGVARLQAEAGRLLSAQTLAHLREAVKLDVEGAALSGFHRELLEQARDQLRQGLPAQAADSAGAALIIVPDSAEGHVLRGRALVGSDDRAALAHLESALRAVPYLEGMDEDLATASFNLGRRLAQRGKRRSAERLLQQAAERYARVAARRNRSAASRYNLAQALIYLSQVQDDGTASRALAESHLRKALNVGRREPNVYANACYWLGTLREQAGDWPMATRYWDAAARVYGPKTRLGKLAQARANRSRGRR